MDLCQQYSNSSDAPDLGAAMPVIFIEELRLPAQTPQVVLDPLTIRGTTFTM